MTNLERGDVERLKKPVRHAGSADPLRIAGVCQVGGAWGEGCDTGEAPGLPPPGGYVRVSGWQHGQAQFQTWVIGPDDRESAGVWIRQRSKQDRVD
jgi:hypothetical protein